MTTIGKYKLEAEIGRGGFGRVYRAYDPSTRRTVAIKVLISQKNEEVLARFRREATATGNLNHKNIVTVYDYGEHENTPYLVMEYLEGEDLRSALSSGKNFSLLEKTSIMSQVADGLQYAHHRGIVHRDIKPANLMILGDGTVKIMDFGIARVLNDLTTNLTRQGDVLGTLSYMAPEVFQGAEVDERSDIFSYGTIYYEIVAGKHPFVADEPARIIYNITSTQPPSISAFAHECPPALEQLISRAVHRDRELRYQSIEDLLFDLMPIRLELQSVEAQNLIRRAETLIGTKQIREAQPVIRQVLQLDPNNTAARELRERVNRELQLQASRERSERLIVSAQEQLNSLQYAKAAETLEAALRVDTNNVEAQSLLEEVRAAIRKRDRAQALIARARRELEADQLTDAYRSILECLQYASEDKEAAALLETIRGAIKARERQRRLAEGLARVEEVLRSGKPEDADALLIDLEISYPAAPRVKELMTEVAAIIAEKKRQQELREKLDAIRELVSQKEWAAALASLQPLQKSFPDEQEVQWLSAYAQEQQQLQRKAEHIQQILREARTANEGRDFERAVSLIKDGLNLYPGEISLEQSLAHTEELRRAYQRQVAIRAARERATELAANNNFSAAIGVIDLTATTWDSDELQELRSQILKRQEAFERAQAIAKAIASIKQYLDREQFQEALASAREALANFPGEPELSALATTAEKRLAEQKRQARIKAACDRAATDAAQNRFEEALTFLRREIAELGGEASLKTLHDQVQAQFKEYERQQAIAAVVASLQESIAKSKYEEAVQAGRDGLTKFPGEQSITKLVETAERALLQQKRERQIATVQEDARSLASVKNFQSALQLLRNSIRELGPEPSLQELSRSIEDQRQEHEKQQTLLAAESRAKEMLRSKDYSSAVGLLEETLKKYPGEAPIEKLRAEAQEKLALQRRTEAIAAILQKARDLLQAREFQAALNAVRAGLKDYPDEARLTEMAAEIKAAMLEVEKQRAIRAALDGAAALRDRGEFSKAAQLLEQALLKAPRHLELQEQLGAIQEKIATQQKVNAVLDEVCDLMSRGVFDVALDRVHRALGEFPGELALSSLLEEVKQSQSSHAIVAACQNVEALRSAGNLSAAMQRVNEVLAAFPGEPSLVGLKSRIQAEITAEQRRQNAANVTAEIRHLLNQQRVDDAISKIENALREFPAENELTTLLAYSNEIVAARRRTDAANERARRARALLQSGKPRDAEKLLNEAIAQYPDEEIFLPLLKRAKDAIETETKPVPREDTLPSLADTLPVEPPKSPDRPAPRAPDPTLGARVSNPERLVRAYRAAIGIGVLIVIGWVAWMLLQGKTNYQQQLDSAKVYFEQKDFAKAIETLQQIPSNSTLYKEAQDLLTAARNADNQKKIDALLAQAAEFHKQNQDDKSLETIRKILELDPSNEAARSIRSEIDVADVQKKSQSEQDEYVKTSLASAHELFDAGNFEAARTEVERVLKLRPDNSDAANLSRGISNQLAAVSRMNAERGKSDQAKAAAEKARAAELDPRGFASALRGEDAALRLQNSKQFDSAAKRFADAAALYRESAARAENQARIDLQNQQNATNAASQLRIQAEAARSDFEQNRNKARVAEAETKAGDRFRNAAAQAQDAQSRFDRGDFAGARAQWEGASRVMLQAMDDVTAGTNQANQQAQRGMEGARNAMDEAKRGLSGTDATAAAEENRARQAAQEGKLGDATAAYQRAANFYRDATQREAQRRDAAQREENDRQAIRGVLERYRIAYQAKDMNAIRAVFPNISGMEEKATSDNFKIPRSTIQVSLDVNSNGIQITGDTAKVQVQLRFDIKVPNAQNSKGEGAAVFNLRKSNGAWLIQSIERIR